jgi:hypothetical protein
MLKKTDSRRLILKTILLSLVLTQTIFVSQPAQAVTGCDTKGGAKESNYLAAQEILRDFDSHIANSIDFPGSWTFENIGFQDASVLIDPVISNYDTRVAQAKVYIDSAQTAILNAQCYGSTHSYYGVTLSIACMNIQLDYLKAWSENIINMEAVYRGIADASGFLKAGSNYSYSWNKLRNVMLSFKKAMEARTTFANNYGSGRTCVLSGSDPNPEDYEPDSAVTSQLSIVLSDYFFYLGYPGSASFNQAFTTLIGDGSPASKSTAVSIMNDIKNSAATIGGNAQTGYLEYYDALWEKLVWHTRSGVAPTLGSSTSTSTGFTVSVTNYDGSYGYTVSSTAGTASINGSGVVTVSGLTSGQLAAVQVNATKTGYTPTSTSASGKALSGLKPAFGSVSTNSTGFTVQVSNYDAGSTWNISATHGSAAINGSGLVSVTGLTESQSSTVTVSTTKTGVPSDSSTVTSAAAGTTTQVITNSVVSGYTRDEVDRTVSSALAGALAQQQALEAEALALAQAEKAAAELKLAQAKEAKLIQDKKDLTIVKKIFANPKTVTSKTVKKLTTNQVSMIPAAAFSIMPKTALAAFSYAQVAKMTPAQVKAIAKR